MTQPDADLVVNQFEGNLRSAMAEDGGLLQRIFESHTDRGFILELHGVRVPFLAKLSQSKKGFWGITSDRAERMRELQNEYLLLLNGPSSGYFISPAAFARLLPRFSRSAKHRAVRINEPIVSGEQRFGDEFELWNLLKDAANSRARE